MSEEFDFDGTQSKRSRTPLQIWDILSILVLILTACLVGYFVVVFINPASALNPLRPGDGLFSNPLPTLTVTPIQLAATWTASPTFAVTPSDTARPTFTPIFTDTPFSLVPPTRTPRPPTATRTPRAQFPASLALAENISSSLYHPEKGCNSLWVVGVVLDKNNAHVQHQQVFLLGTLNGKTINMFTVAGLAQDWYGRSGFEFELESPPVDSKGTLYLQLWDQNGTQQLSENVPINTSSDCAKNMTYVRFKANR